MDDIFNEFSKVLILCVPNMDHMLNVIYILGKSVQESFLGKGQIQVDVGTLLFCSTVCGCVDGLNLHCQTDSPTELESLFQ